MGLTNNLGEIVTEVDVIIAGGTLLSHLMSPQRGVKAHSKCYQVGQQPV